MNYKYAKPLHRIYLGTQKLFPRDDSAWEESWEPQVPEPNATLWRYMSFAKFCSLMERQGLFFALVGNMEDQYEGFICPPLARDQGDHLYQAEGHGYKILSRTTKASLVNCWVNSEHESSLMWKSYAGVEGVAIRTTFQDLQKSIRSTNNTTLPVIFGKVEYADLNQQETPRFRSAPLFHKRVEYRGEEEVRAALPGPQYNVCLDPSNPNDPIIDMELDPDVAEQQGRYIPVNLEILVRKIIVAPQSAKWFRQLVQDVVSRHSPVEVRVTSSTLESLPDGSNGHDAT